MPLFVVKYLKTLKIISMLIPDNIKPENTLYYNGAFILRSLENKESIALLDLYQRVKEKKNMSFSLFILCLDWLFLISVVELNEKQEVKLCS